MNKWIAAAAFAVLFIASVDAKEARAIPPRAGENLPARATEERPAARATEDRWSSQQPGSYYGPGPGYGPGYGPSQAPYPYYNYPGSYPPGPPFPDQDEADAIYRANQRPPT